MADRPSHKHFKKLRSVFSSREGKVRGVKELLPPGASTSNDGFLPAPTNPACHGESLSHSGFVTDDERSSYQASEAGSINPADEDGVPQNELGRSNAKASFWEQAYQDLLTNPKTKSLMKDYDRVMAESKNEAAIKDKKVDGSDGLTAAVVPAANGSPAAAAPANSATEGPGAGGDEEQQHKILGKDSEMKDLVSQKLKEMEDSEWVIKWKGNEVFRVRKAVSEAVKIVQKFSGLASSAASLDPLHAGLVWAGVSCVLPLLLNDTKERTKAVDGIASTSETAARYLLIERDYRDGKLGKNDDFERSAIKICTEILIFYAQAAVFFARNEWKRWLVNTFKIDDWTGALEAISEAETACERFSAILTSSALLKGRQEIAKLLAAHEEETIHKMEAWVSNTQVGEQHHQVREKLGRRYAGSGKWLLDLPAFVEWKNSSHGNFWLRGAVGMGKSSLVSIVVEKMKNEEDNFAYFYCTNALSIPEATESPKCTIIRALAAQLALSPDKKSIAEEVKLKYEKYVSEGLTGVKPGYEDFLELFSRLIASRNSITLVIDALDECPDYVELLAGLKILSERNNNLRLLVSSQRVVPVNAYLTLSINTISSAQNLEDITSFIRGEIEVYKSYHPGVLTDELSRDIVDTLSDKAEGMFKWVDLRLRFLLDPSDEAKQADIQENLDTIKKKPNQGIIKKMVEAYHTLYKKHLPLNPDTSAKREAEAEKILAWAFASIRPLHLHEILSLGKERYVKEVENPNASEQDISKLCRIFLFVSENSQLVEMSHSSVSDYLALKFSGKLDEFLADTKTKIDDKKLLQDAHDLSKVLVNRRVAEESISYLLSTKDLKFGQDHAINPESLLSYTAEFWFQHAKVPIRSVNQVINEDQEEMVQEIPEDLRGLRSLFNPQNCGAFDNWLTIHDPDKVTRIKGKDHSSGGLRGQQLYYAMLLGIWDVARDMIDDNRDVNIVGGYFGNCIQLAAYRGNQPTVSKLLDKDVMLNVEAGIFGSALQAAASQGHTDICSMLLNHGADVNATGGLLCNPLQAALTRGSKATIELLTSRIGGTDLPYGNLWKDAFSNIPEEKRKVFGGHLTRFVTIDLPHNLTFEQELLASVVEITRNVDPEKAFNSFLEASELQRSSRISGTQRGYYQAILQKISDNDKNEPYYLYNQLPLIAFYLILQSGPKIRRIQLDYAPVLDAIARIISQHGYFLVHAMLPRVDNKESLLTEILTYLYTEIFKMLVRILEQSRLTAFRYAILGLRHRGATQSDPRSRATFPENWSCEHEKLHLNRETVPTSPKTDTSRPQTAQSVTGELLQTNRTTVEAWEPSQNEL
ncbi:Ankyrin repeat-containing protein [Glarea lozoyensis ATCC 20868]|uniref:Ankyrin repeat-containing protein n=1 Tax=Glarea lozoyensis (strain ATCC 20868 / MF5171) TaxID=1116229 RepID=S3CMZ6_GLAL2|nr:Ankyrin repeat-containing protein [Glarea lozoyensis ATCC 20868]EPE26584.1 Ankyrin repeat-containing protein [Glarea lozoyensis ATCC 20868]